MTNKIAYKDILRHGLITLLFIFYIKVLSIVIVKVAKSQKKSLILFTCLHNVCFVNLYVCMYYENTLVGIRFHRNTIFLPFPTRKLLSFLYWRIFRASKKMKIGFIKLGTNGNSIHIRQFEHWKSFWDLANLNFCFVLDSLKC